MNVEPYYYSSKNSVSRVRVIGGLTASWGKLLAFEPNITYQYDSDYDTKNTIALNLILHVFFETKNAKPKTTGLEQPLFDNFYSSTNSDKANGSK